MTTYQSIHTGEAIDEGVTKGTSAVQPDTEASLTTLTLGVSPDPLTEGQMAWNAEDGTIDIGLNGGGVILQTGQEVLYRVENNTGSTILDGTLVMAAGSPGNSGKIRVAPAVSDGSVPARFILGVTTEDIANGALGYVTSFGKVRGLDTSAFSAGDVLWADPTTPGGLTATEPAAPNLKLAIAFVINSHANVGTLMVRVDTGSRMVDLYDVETTTPSDGDTLVYDGPAGVWKPTFLAASGTYTPTATGIVNCDTVTTFESSWFRVGNVVQVSGRVDVDPTASGDTRWSLSLPVPGDLVVIYDLAGTAARRSGSVSSPGAVYAGVTSDEAEFQMNIAATSTQEVYFSFSYKI